MRRLSRIAQETCRAAASALAAAPRVLVGAAAGHLVLGLACVLALLADAPPILGMHPALKPAKFAFSIAVFLTTVAVLLPNVSASSRARQRLAWVLAATMIIEMVAIAGQAARGTTSHFNTAGIPNNLMWQLMMAAIVVTTVAMVWLAWVATKRPLLGRDGQPMPRLLALGWRAGLWMFLLAAASGFAMGGRLQHSVGGVDGGPGLPVVNWSTAHGDLRVSHFWALHALQLLPLLGLVLSRVPIPRAARVGLMRVAALAYFALCTGTLWQALAGRPFL